MKAAVHDRYGPPEVLRIEEVARPVPADDEVLVNVHATAVNRTDTGFRSAEYFISRFYAGLRRPRRRILGSRRRAGDRAAPLTHWPSTSAHQKTGNVVLTVRAA